MGRASSWAESLSLGGDSRYNLSTQSDNLEYRVLLLYVDNHLPPPFLLAFNRVQGILLEHRELEFGDKVNADDVLRAARRIPQEPLQRRN